MLLEPCFVDFLHSAWEGDLYCLAYSMTRGRHEERWNSKKSCMASNVFNSRFVGLRGSIMPTEIFPCYNFWSALWVWLIKRKFRIVWSSYCRVDTDWGRLTRRSVHVTFDCELTLEPFEWRLNETHRSGKKRSQSMWKGAGFGRFSDHLLEVPWLKWSGAADRSAERPPERHSL